MGLLSRYESIKSREPTKGSECGHSAGSFLKPGAFKLFWKTIDVTAKWRSKMVIEKKMR